MKKKISNNIKLGSEKAKSVSIESPVLSAFNDYIYIPDREIAISRDIILFVTTLTKFLNIFPFSDVE